MKKEEVFREEIPRPYSSFITELEEENRLLNNEIAWLKDHTKYNEITEEYYIDGTMTATEAKLRLQQAEDNQNYVSNIEEENRKLKEEIKIRKLTAKDYAKQCGVELYDNLDDIIEK